MTSPPASVAFTGVSSSSGQGRWWAYWLDRFAHGEPVRGCANRGLLGDERGTRALHFSRNGRASAANIPCLGRRLERAAPAPAAVVARLAPGALPQSGAESRAHSRVPFRNL